MEKAIKVINEMQSKGIKFLNEGDVDETHLEEILEKHKLKTKFEIFRRS